jgi:hypothetical protein
VYQNITNNHVNQTAGHFTLMKHVIKYEINMSKLFYCVRAVEQSRETNPHHHSGKYGNRLSLLEVNITSIPLRAFCKRIASAELSELPFYAVACLPLRTLNLTADYLVYCTNSGQYQSTGDAYSS